MAKKKNVHESQERIKKKPIVDKNVRELLQKPITDDHKPPTIIDDHKRPRGARLKSE